MDKLPESPPQDLESPSPQIRQFEKLMHDFSHAQAHAFSDFFRSPEKAWPLDGALQEMYGLKLARQEQKALAAPSKTIPATSAATLRPLIDKLPAITRTLPPAHQTYPE